jgi:hypothetical protein
MCHHRLICPVCENVIWIVDGEIITEKSTEEWSTSDLKWEGNLTMRSHTCSCPDCAFVFKNGDKCTICEKGVSFYQGGDAAFSEADFREMMNRRMNKCLIPRAEYIRQFKVNTQASVYPLLFEKGHIFINIDNGLWLIDTGSPASFGKTEILNFCNKQFSVSKNFHTFTADIITQFVGVPCVGLIGADVLNCFDIVFNTTMKTLVVSVDELTIVGESVGLDEMMGIPIVPVEIEGKEYRMIFDTGAQISYFQSSTLTQTQQFPSAGVFEDFHLTIGNYRTETNNVSIMLCGIPFTIRCGSLPDSIGATLIAASTEGIVSNEIFHNRIVGYFPRRNIMIIS